jgi:ribonuclease R
VPHVSLLDRIDRPARRLQFALIPSAEPQSQPPRSLRKSKPELLSPTRTGKPGRTKSKARTRDQKAKGKRK